jgi:sn-glycerol 3-phosphate transport system substrate-binding protein
MPHIDALVSAYPFPNFMEPIQERAAEFERAHPGYRVTVTGCGYEELPAEVAKLAAEGRAPTLATYYSGATQQALDTVDHHGKPVFTSLGQAVGGRTSILGEPVVHDDLIPAARDFFTRDGELVAMPFVLSTMLLYTNRTVLAAAGVEHVPETWQDLTEACRAIARLDGGPSHRITWPIDGKLFQQAMAQQGALLVDRENGHAGRPGKVDFGTPALRAYVSWWRRLAEEGHYYHTGELEDWGANFQAFADQKVAFRFGSSFDVNFMRAAAAERGFEIDVHPLPHNGDLTRAGNWIGGDAFWLADGLDDATRDGALAFVQYVSSPRHAATWHQSCGTTPISHGSVTVLDQNGWFAEHPYHRVANEQLELTTRTTGSCAPVFAGSYGVQRALMRAMEAIVVHGADVTTRLRQAEEEAQRALEDYNSAVLGSGPRGTDWLVVGS